MAWGYSGYERELRRILEGEDAAYLRRFPAIAKLRDEPFLVVRAAGSLGADIIIARRNWCFPIEVKSGHHNLFHFSAASGRAQEQYEDLLRKTRRAGLPLIYAFRRIGAPKDEDPWRVYRAGKEKIAGGVAQVGRTKGGARVLRWADGVPLHLWIEIIQAHEDDNG